MNGAYRPLRMVASVVSMGVTAIYILTDHTDPAILLALIGWNLTCLGLYQWSLR